MTAWVPSWSMTHWWKSGKTLPKLMPPMHRRGIRIPVCPRVVYSMDQACPGADNGARH